MGTDDYRRITADLNHQISDTAAFRINAMHHYNQVADRGPTEFERWGFAPSLSFGLGTPTRATLSYFHQKDDNIPDFGVPVNRHGDRMKYISRDYQQVSSGSDGFLLFGVPGAGRTIILSAEATF